MSVSSTRAENSGPDRNTFGSAMLATRAVANAGPTPATHVPVEEPFTASTASMPEDNDDNDPPWLEKPR